MADVTGPISTLPGARHDLPDGTMCDEHPERLAVVRVQGETDSFGSEMNDLCRECLDKDREWEKSPEATEWRKGQCEWCKSEATDLSDARDYEEGMAGHVYQVCGGCIKRRDQRLAEEARYYDDGRDYDD